MVKHLKAYGLFGLIRLSRDLVCSKIFFPGSRIVRWPFYIKNYGSMKIGKGFSAGRGLLIEVLNTNAILNIGERVFVNQNLHVGVAQLVEIGDDTLIASFVYISDVVRAFALSAKSKVKNEAFNVGYPKCTSINLLASFFKIKKKYLKKKKGDIKFSRSNINKIYKLINWKPMITLKRGLKQTLKYKKKYS